jgi:hypothetical protein
MGSLFVSVRMNFETCSSLLNTFISVFSLHKYACRTDTFLYTEHWDILTSYPTNVKLLYILPFSVYTDYLPSFMYLCTRLERNQVQYYCGNLLVRPE